MRIGELVLLITALGAAGDVAYGADVETSPQRVSLIQLLANPREFHGKRVEVEGFCRLEFEGNALYLHKEDFDHGLSLNGLWLSIGWPVPRQYVELSDEYVVVDAVFDAEHKGHMNGFAGSLSDVEKIERLAPRAEIERALRLALPRSQRR